MAQDQWTLQEKEQEKSKTGARAASCRPVLQLPTGQFLPLATTILAHMDMDRWGQSKMNGGKRREGQWAWHGKGGRQAKPAEQGRCRRTQPADGLPGTGLEANNSQAVGRPRSKTTAADDVGRPLAVQCRLMEGVRWCWHSRGGLRPTSLPPIAFACHCLYPLP